MFEAIECAECGDSAPHYIVADPETSEDGVLSF